MAKVKTKNGQTILREKTVKFGVREDTSWVDGKWESNGGLEIETTQDYFTLTPKEAKAFYKAIKAIVKGK